MVSTICACIPSFNAAGSISQVVKEAYRFCDIVIVINDGSVDDTENQAKQAGARVINHPRNLGYGAAILSCLRAGIEAGADIIVTLDADMQHNPKEIPLLVQPVIEGRADITTGSRFVRKDVDNGIPTYRKFGIQVITKVTNAVAQISITDATTGFRAYSNHAARVLASKSFSSEMAASSQIIIEAFRSKLHIQEVYVNISYNTGTQTSTQNALAMGIRMLISVIHYVTLRRPLSLLGIPGLAMTLLGLASSVFLLDIFDQSGQIKLGLGLLAVGITLTGIILMIAALILYRLASISAGTSVQRLERKINYSE